jgi:hypothetical protein
MGCLYEANGYVQSSWEVNQWAVGFSDAPGECCILCVMDPGRSVPIAMDLNSSQGCWRFYPPADKDSKTPRFWLRNSKAIPST